MTDTISIFAGMAKSLEDCPPPEEREARLKMVMAADALRKADAKIKALTEALALADAALSGANMNLSVVERKVLAALDPSKAAK